MAKKKASGDAKEHVAIHADVICAKCFSLVDKNGRERVSMSMTGANEECAQICIYGDDDEPRITMQVHRDESAIAIEQTGSLPGVSLVVSNRSNGIGIADLQGRPIYQCGIYRDPSHAGRNGKPAIILRDFETGDGWEIILGNSSK
ncbi:MAG: hypothetical protein D6753_17090 [Planctomycetota bacterium]|nr:MAG: hypothetical protein D6753_17090 [Planctomycetota bacterium]